MNIIKVSGAPKHILDDDIPFVWCDEDYTISETSATYPANDDDDDFTIDKILY